MDTDFNDVLIKYVFFPVCYANVGRALDMVLSIEPFWITEVVNDCFIEAVIPKISLFVDQNAGLTNTPLAQLMHSVRKFATHDRNKQLLERLQEHVAQLQVDTCIDPAPQENVGVDTWLNNGVDLFSTVFDII